MTSHFIKEGFLCPICLKDLGTVTQLQSHFEEAHTTEERAVTQQLKGLFEKAKKRLLGDKEQRLNSSYDRGSDFLSSLCSVPTGLHPSCWEPQELGVTRNRTDAFKAVRDARVDRFVIETNKLLIRLDKLISPEAPSESAKRKNFEKEIVPWIPDSDVQQCPTCAKKFTVTRRRHHCRLCGGIICDGCSNFLSFLYAKKLTDPAFSFSGDKGFLRRTGSNTSLNSLMNSEGEQHIRTCMDCRRLLERRDQLVQQRNTKPAILQLYEILKGCIREAEGHLSKFFPMVDSLSIGESTYSLSEARQLQSLLLKLYERIDAVSKKLMLLGLSTESQPAPRQIYLQRAIRTFSTNFLHENMSRLQSLPSGEEYKKLQESYQLEMQRKIAAERQALMEVQEQERKLLEEKETASHIQQQQHGMSPSHQAHKRSDSNSSVGKGWKPAKNSFYAKNTNDPMLQQMEIIRSYIKQAKQARKWDEVEMLEQNLKELQMEYRRQQKE